ncbi:MAG: hypothetical protein ACYDAQ_12025 [Mycobacteriales bacterium]
MAAWVVIGGGSFGGLTTTFEFARLLGPERASITLISKESRFTFAPSLPWVAMGARRLEQISFDLAGPFARRGVRFVHEAVTAVQRGGRRPRSLRWARSLTDVGC